ncbi:Co-chaperone HscB, C-terminal oligomerization domain-containing protein [Ampelomyces quisqualis]|uniref:Co-chaperone HscB, C-terminal oligomerization domain-containing protein n=1 Tax=Ampelomyces quisqualis TaxID=50730 RepID=A0A6A5QBL9_AMPQU|nr:Co-chaperone HscB, C-terminal oligomerization domain-containing protein [Ampelomyces quisqualis]
MRSIRSAAVHRLRTGTTSQTLPSPFRTRQAAPCIFCAHFIEPQPQSRRFQSNSPSWNTREEPFSAQTSPQPAAPQTHYDFFPKSLSSGAPPNAPFTIDLSALKREFLQLQARAHPDMHPQADKKRAEALSARINEAYKTLQNPLLRAQYLLSLRGIQVAEDETAKVEDADLLMEVLEAREEIEEAESEEDLVDMKSVNDERIRASEEVLERAFQQDDIEGAKGEAVRLRYWINIKESIDGWEKGKPVVLQH